MKSNVISIQLILENNGTYSANGSKDNTIIILYGADILDLKSRVIDDLDGTGLEPNFIETNFAPEKYCVEDAY